MDRNLSSVASGLIAAAIDEAQFQPAFDDIRKYLHAEAAAIERIDLRSGSVDVFGYRGLSDDVVGDYTSHYCHISPRVDFALHMQTGVIANDLEMAAGKGELAREFYDWFAKNSEFSHCIGTKLFHSGSRITLFGLHFENQAATLDSEVRKRLELVAPILRSFEQLRSDIEIAQRTFESRRDIDRVGTPYALLSSDRRVLGSNRGFQQLLLSNPSIVAWGGRIRLTDSKQDKAFETAVGDAFSGADQVIPLSVGAQGRMFCHISRKSDENDAVVAYFVSDTFEISRAKARQAFSLSATEAEVCVRIMRGLTNGEICAELGMREGTLRVHLRNIFPKVGVSRQADLVRALLAASVRFR